MRFRRDGRRIAAALKAWYGSLKTIHQIAVWVVAVHCVALFWMTIDHFITRKPIHRPIVVRTVHPVVAKPAAVPVATLPVKTASAAPPKTKPAPAAAKKKTVTAPTSKPVEKKKAVAPVAVEKALIQPAKTRTAGVELKLPSFIESKSVDASVQTETSERAQPYGDWLVDALQRSLQLPEIGDVKVRLTLRSSGLIERVEILQAKSEKNADWLKKQLPLLELPCFNDFGICDAALEFTITFRNVENR